MNLDPDFLPIDNENHRLSIFANIILVTNWFRTQDGTNNPTLRVLPNKNNQDLRCICFTNDCNLGDESGVQFNIKLSPGERDASLPYDLEFVKRLYTTWKSNNKLSYLQDKKTKNKPVEQEAIDHRNQEPHGAVPHPEISITQYEKGNNNRLDNNKYADDNIEITKKNTKENLATKGDDEKNHQEEDQQQEEEGKKKQKKKPRHA